MIIQVSKELVIKPLKVGSINYHRNVIHLKYGVDVLPSFRFLSVHTVSIFGHIARYAPSSADTLPSKEIRKSVKANL